MTDTDYLKHILNANVYEVAIETPLEKASRLSERTKTNFLIKREDMQAVFSFKCRGAYNKMVKLSPEQRQRGVITASAGNHAQGVALAAKKLGCTALIYLPATTPKIKVEAIKRLGGQTILHGTTYDDAYREALSVQKKEGLAYVHPYDDLDVIAGQGTIGVEILRQYNQPIDAIFCPVGGGGLIAGVATYIKQLRPKTRVIGVEANDSNALAQSLQANKRITLDQVGLFADGTAVRTLGEKTFPICQQYVDEVVCVNTDAICAAIKDVFEDARSILEPSGALAIAGAKKWLGQQDQEDHTIVAIASGANMNFDRLYFAAERAEVGERREIILAVRLPEKPGSYLTFLSLLGAHNITEFNYRYHHQAEAHVFVGVQVNTHDEAAPLINKLRQNGYETLDLTKDEMSKSHLRYLVGGHAQIENEVLYRFEFPERPGSLFNFLNRMSLGWNISLFHYRNHGADTSKVLAGIQVSPEEMPAFNDFLKKLGYQYWNESNNPGYALFLN